MIKTFYKATPAKKIFFSPGQRIKSCAYGDEVHLEFLDWRRRYLAKWNSPKENFWLLENGPIDGNFAKIDKVEEFRVSEPRASQRTISKKENGLSSLWLEGCTLDVDSLGDLLVNGAPTGISLGTDLKAWGASIRWIKGQPEYLLLVYGKNEDSESELRAYRLALQGSLAVTLLSAVPLKATLNKKARLYCFSSHVFLVSDAKLAYYYYNDLLQRLEEVALGSTDTPNSEKAFCVGVTGDIVCDGDGYVYFCADNRIFYFPVGYPSKISRIELGESNEIFRIQTFRDTLFVYYRSKITHEYTTMAYVVGPSGATSGIFNTDSLYNLFYAEKNGLLYYVKLLPGSQRALVVRQKSGNEAVLSEISVCATKQLFCANGNLYLNCSYVSAT